MRNLGALSGGLVIVESAAEGVHPVAESDQTGPTGGVCAAHAVVFDASPTVESSASSSTPDLRGPACLIVFVIASETT